MFDQILKNLKFSLAAIPILIVPGLIFAQDNGDNNDDENEIEDAEVREQEQEPLHPLDRVEFRSLASLPGGMMFSLYDSELNQPFWIEIGQSFNGFEAVEFYASTNTLTLRYGDSVRDIHLNNRRVVNPDGINRDDLNRRERRQLRREERREEARQEREDFNHRFQVAALSSPEIRQVREQYGELREAWTELRNNMNTVSRGSEEFEALREQGRALRQEQRLLHRFARDAVASHPSFTRDDREHIDRMFGQGNNN